MKATLTQRSGLLAVLTACVIPIHIWALLLIAAAIPQWLLRLNQGQLVSSIGYALAMTLFETVIIFAIVMALLLVLPKRLVEPTAVPLAFAFVTLTTLLMIYVIIFNVRDPLQMGFGLVAYLVAVVVSYILIKRWSRLANTLTSLIDRLVPLALLYLVLDLAGLILVIVRNVTA